MCKLKWLFFIGGIPSHIAESFKRLQIEKSAAAAEAAATIITTYIKWFQKADNMQWLQSYILLSAFGTSEEGREEGRKRGRISWQFCSWSQTPSDETAATKSSTSSVSARKCSKTLSLKAIHLHLLPPPPPSSCMELFACSADGFGWTAVFHTSGFLLLIRIGLRLEQQPLDDDMEVIITGCWCLNLLVSCSLSVFAA